MNPESHEPDSRATGGRAPWPLYLAVAVEAALLLAFVLGRILR